MSQQLCLQTSLNKVLPGEGVEGVGVEKLEFLFWEKKGLIEWKTELSLV